MIKIEEMAYHRNGMSGAGFFVVKFVDPEISKPKTRLIDKVNQIEGAKGQMIGIVFDAPYHVAVFDRSLLAQGIIAFGANSFRGDYYENDLRKAVEICNRTDWATHGVERAVEIVNAELNGTRRAD